jgi:hypothetical protein
MLLKVLLECTPKLHLWDSEGETKRKQQQEGCRWSNAERVVCSEEGQRCRLLQLVGDELNEGLHLLVLPVDKLVLLLDGEAAFAKGDDVESGVLVSASGADDVLKKSASLSEERLCSLLSIGVSTDAIDDADSLQVAALGEQVHARHGSALDVGSDGNVQHGLACLITDHADEVESGGSGVEMQFEGIENQAGLGSDLDKRD